jgi:serine/threonine-protein kinase
MRNDIQRALSGVPLAAPAQTAAYQGTRRMGPSTAMAGRTGSIPPYEYGAQEQPPRGGGRRRWPWIVAALVALALIGVLIFVFQYISSSGSGFAVPQVNNLPQATAEKQIADAHLIANVVKRPSDSVPKGYVINTNPANGKQVKENSTVTLFVSTGAAKVPVPSVTGKQESAAESILQGAGFKVTPVSVTNSSAPQGQVIRQNPPAGTKLAPGGNVTISVSGGGVPVPSVVGDPASTAQQILEGAGFSVNVKTVAGPGGATPGNVFSQTPAGNTKAPSRSQVTIFVAATPATPTPTPTPTVTPTSSPTETVSPPPST